MKRILNTLVILIVLDVLCAGGLWFGYTTMQEKKANEGELRRELIIEGQKGKKLLALKRTLAAVEKDHAEMSKFLFDSSDESQIEFVSRIERLGTSTTGVLVETTSLDLTTDPTPSLRGVFAMKGTWGQMYHLLRLLEEFPSRLVISRFDAKGSTSEAGWSGGVSIVLSSLKSTPQ